MAGKSRIVLLKGEQAARAGELMDKEFAASKAELDAAGAKSYEAVILTEDGQAVSAVDGDEANN